MGGRQQRIEVIVCENAKKSQDGRGVEGSVRGGLLRGSGGCKPRIEGIVKCGAGSVRGIRV